MPSYQEWDVLKQGQYVGSVVIQAHSDGRCSGVHASVERGAPFRALKTWYRSDSIAERIRLILGNQGLTDVEVKLHQSWFETRKGHRERVNREHERPPSWQGDLPIASVLPPVPDVRP